MLVYVHIVMCYVCTSVQQSTHRIQHTTLDSIDKTMNI